MKRFALLIGLLSFVATSLQAQPSKRQKYDEDRYGVLNGDVKSLRYKCSKAEIYFGDIRKGEVTEHRLFEFDSAGNVVDENWYNSDGSLLCKYLYKYNSVGSVVEENEYYSDGSLRCKIIYKYDSAGNMVEESKYNSNGSLRGKYLYEYDSAGNMVEEATYNSKGSLRYKAVSKYNSAGNMVEDALYEANGLLRDKGIYEYDSAGNQITESCYNTDGSLRCKIIYKYDSLGNKIEFERYIGDGSLSYRELYKYDSAGNRVEWAEYKADGSMLDIRYYEYTYDSENNWIKRVEYRGEARIATDIVTREITYYREDSADDSLDSDDDEKEKNVEEEPAFVKVDIMPSFMGGDLNTFRAWFSGEFKIPAVAAKNGIQGRVVMKFVVEKDGSIGGIEFLQSPDKVYEDEARRVLMKSPRWTPGRHRDQVVRVFYILPIDCRLQ